MKNKNKLIILSSIIVGVLVLALGLTYAAISFNRTGGTSQLVLGDIYMHYNETNSISLEGAMPGDDYNIGNPNSYFEFTINGKNTYTKKDIWYDIIVTRGELPNGKNEEYRIPDEYLKFRLVEVVNGEEKEIFTNKTYNHITNRKIHIDTIPVNTTSEYNKTYRLYMTISSNLEIGNSADAVYTTETWESAFASIKVNVTGDFNKKQMPGTMARLGTKSSKFWSDDIENVKSSIKEVNFLELSNEEIDTRYNAASIKSDVTTVEEYPIKAWLEPTESDPTMYTMYVASSDMIYFPSDSSFMFYMFENSEKIKFDNIDTSQTSKMRFMFSNCSNLTNLDLSKFNTMNVVNMQSMFSGSNSITEIMALNIFDTEKVTNMGSMFQGCSSLIELDLNSWDTSQVEAMGFMFDGCSSLKEISLNNFDVSKVNYMTAIFQNCSSLKSLNLSNWELTNLSNLNQLFNGCTDLLTLDISNFIFNNVADNNIIFKNVGSNLPSGTYTTVYVKTDYVLNGTTYSPQSWILNLTSSNRPTGWSTANVIVKE